MGGSLPAINALSPHPEGHMTLRVPTTLSGGLLLVPIMLGTAAAQTTYPNVKLTGKLQEQFYFFDNDPYAATTGPNSNFFTRRARIEARGQITENIAVYIVPSFEGGRNLSNVVTTCTGVPLVCRTTGR